ncbi:chaplin [Streptomyces longisporoflavus]|uniref:Chaplin n=1 Tax=Streptomyces longisporoflavus TaxID=28044 RepID=A0ABW7QH60_9ACTN
MRVRTAFAAAALAATALLGGAGAAAADAGAEGAAVKSPGVLSGNVVQVPVHVPVNACGLSVNVVGLLNPAQGNACANK